MGWLIALAVIALLSLVRLGIRADYNSGGANAYLYAGPFRATLYPSQKADKKGDKPGQKRDKSTKKEKGGSLSDFYPLLDALLDFLDDFLLRKLRVKMLQVKIVMAGEDPCDLAVNYGRAWAAVGNVIPLLERFFVIKKRDIQLECDFDGEKTLIDAHLNASITLGRAIVLAGRHGWKLLREYMKIVKLRKGGAL